jgi:flagella basal body P-ring formation protein FlgA
LTAAANRVLDRAILQADHPDVTYALRTNLAGCRVPIGRASRELKPRLHTGALGTSHAHVDVDVVIDGAVHKTIPIYYSLTRYYKVLTLAFSVRAGTELNEANLTFKRIATPHGVTQYLTSFDSVRGKIANKLLRRGEMLTLQHLGVRSIIQAGDIVELQLQSGQIKVKTRVRAMDAGHIGKFIRVVRLNATAQRGRQGESGPVLVAKVQSPNTVVIDSNQ